MDSAFGKSDRGLSVTALDREEARVRAFRERAEARRDRFLNARTRTIGVSTIPVSFFLAVEFDLLLNISCFSVFFSSCLIPRLLSPSLSLSADHVCSGEGRC